MKRSIKLDCIFNYLTREVYLLTTKKSLWRRLNVRRLKLEPHVRRGIRLEVNRGGRAVFQPGWTIMVMIVVIINRS